MSVQGPEPKVQEKQEEYDPLRQKAQLYRPGERKNQAVEFGCIGKSQDGIEFSDLMKWPLSTKSNKRPR